MQSHREWLLALHGPVCAYCGTETAPEMITLDHVRPRRGQTAYDRPDNLVFACRDCNAAKAVTPLVASPPELPEQADEDAGDAAPDETDGSLAMVAKAAAMKAERAAIEQTLRQVHWNRRKAAQLLGVSYKTLLNKIKECGISRA